MKGDDCLFFVIVFIQRKDTPQRFPEANSKAFFSPEYNAKKKLRKCVPYCGLEISYTLAM